MTHTILCRFSSQFTVKHLFSIDLDCSMLRPTSAYEIGVDFTKNAVLEAAYGSHFHCIVLCDNNAPSSITVIKLIFMNWIQQARFFWIHTIVKKIFFICRVTSKKTFSYSRLSKTTCLVQFTALCFRIEGYNLYFRGSRKREIGQS